MRNDRPEIFRLHKRGTSERSDLLRRGRFFASILSRGPLCPHTGTKRLVARLNLANDRISPDAVNSVRSNLPSIRVMGRFEIQKAPATHRWIARHIFVNVFKSFGWGGVLGGGRIRMGELNQTDQISRYPANQLKHLQLLQNSKAVSESKTDECVCVCVWGRGVQFRRDIAQVKTGLIERLATS